MDCKIGDLSTKLNLIHNYNEAFELAESPFRVMDEWIHRIYMAIYLFIKLRAIL